jgi:hypothetical protein
MASAVFYSQNEGRAYPLVDVDTELLMLYSGGGELPLPNDAIVDVTLVLGIGADFDPRTHRVYLYEVSRSGNRFDFVFRFDLPTLTGRLLTFCRYLEDPEFATSYAVAADDAGSSSTELVCDGIVTEGWLVTGKMASLAGLLADGQWLRRADGQVQVEPARIQTLDGGFIRTLNLANAARIKVDNDLCSPISSAVPDDFVINAMCLQGPVRFRAGFSCAIEQDTLNNQITINAAVGSGLGEPCEDVPLFDGESPPGGSNLFSGGPACHEIIKTINGLSGPHVRVSSGRGVRVEASEDDPHRLIVRIDFHGVAVCEGEA